MEDCLKGKVKKKVEHENLPLASFMLAGWHHYHCATTVHKITEAFRICNLFGPLNSKLVTLEPLYRTS